MDFNTNNLLQKIITPPLVTENDAYLLKFAENDDEVFAAQKLRYRVFNCEQNRGLDSAKDAEFDRDGRGRSRESGSFAGRRNRERHGCRRHRRRRLVLLAQGEDSHP